VGALWSYYQIGLRNLRLKIIKTLNLFFCFLQKAAKTIVTRKTFSVLLASRSKLSKLAFFKYIFKAQTRPNFTIASL